MLRCLWSSEQPQLEHSYCDVADAGRRGCLPVEPERSVGQLWKPRVRLAVAIPHPQIGQHRAVMVALSVLFFPRLGDAVGAREQAVDVIEASVLWIDNDDRVDPGKIGCGDRLQCG